MSNPTGGKGSKPRPIPDRKQFEDNWDRIFKPKQPKEHTDKDEHTNTTPTSQQHL